MLDASRSPGFLGSILIFALVLVAQGSTALAGPADGAERAAKDRRYSVIVKLRDGGLSVDNKAKVAGATAVGGMAADGRYKLYAAASPAGLDDLKKRLASDPGVEYVEDNVKAEALFTPNDTHFGKQWNLGLVQAPAAWDLAPKPGGGVKVAVLDTGAAYEDYGPYHRIPDFSGTAFVPGWDFVNGDAHPNDDHGHGTHVTGVIAQTTNNAYGTSGLAFRAKIMPVKVLDAWGSGDAFDIAQGIRWAADNGAKVINLSLALGGPSKAVEDQINYAVKTKKATVVAAAGNSADQPDWTGGLKYPAAYPTVISVGAVRYDKQRASYSEYAAGLDLVAPGGELGLDQNGDGHGDGILQETIRPGDPSRHGFYWFEGTSQAAPHVSAAAAILIARGTTGPAAVREALTKTARDLGKAGYDSEYGHGLLNVKAALKYQALSTTWYFAEGNTARGFDTKILISNPANRTAKVRATFSKPDGTRIIKGYSIKAARRFTIAVDKIGGLTSTAVSTKLESTNGVGIAADRAMYFDYKRKRGGHATVGATAAAAKWYLAEGYTGGDFETQVLIYNPNSVDAKVRATFTKPKGGQVARDYLIKAWGRERIVVDDLPGLGSAEFATKVESLNGPGIVVERSMYFNHQGRDGGHNTVGVRAPKTRWLFAEGTTAGSFETWILVQNPAAGDAKIRATFSKPDGTRVVRSYVIKPGRRLTISVDSLPGLAATDVATEVRSLSGVGVIAERAMYFNHNGHKGGHVTVGAAKPSIAWHLADGSTAGDFETWVLLYNPGSKAAKITARFMKADGTGVFSKLTVPAGSRRSILVDSVAGVSNTRFATKVTAVNGVPIVVERAVYFGYGSLAGGDCSIGYGL